MRAWQRWGVMVSAAPEPELDARLRAHAYSPLVHVEVGGENWTAWSGPRLEVLVVARDPELSAQVRYADGTSVEIRNHAGGDTEALLVAGGVDEIIDAAQQVLRQRFDRPAVRERDDLVAAARAMIAHRGPHPTLRRVTRPAPAPTGSTIRLESRPLEAQASADDLWLSARQTAGGVGLLRFSPGKETGETVAELPPDLRAWCLTTDGHAWATADQLLVHRAGGTRTFTTSNPALDIRGDDEGCVLLATTRGWERIDTDGRTVDSRTISLVCPRFLDGGPEPFVLDERRQLVFGPDGRPLAPRGAGVHDACRVGSLVLATVQSPRGRRLTLWEDGDWRHVTAPEVQGKLRVYEGSVYWTIAGGVVRFDPSNRTVHRVNARARGQLLGVNRAGLWFSDERSLCRLSR